MLQWRTWYKTGTVAVVNGSPTVTGTTTAWTNQAKPGDIFTINKDRFYEILSVDSNTGITLAENYAGSTASGQSYAIIRCSPAWNDISDAAVKLAAYLEDVDALPPTTKGDLFGFSTTRDRVPIGTNGQVLTADSAQALGLKWALPHPLTTKGDIVGYSTAAARVPIGTNGHALIADSDQALGLKWALPHPLTTKGDLFGYSTAAARVAVGSNGALLTADSAQSAGVAWVDPATTGANKILKLDGEGKVHSTVTGMYYVAQTSIADDAVLAIDHPTLSVIFGAMIFFKTTTNTQPHGLFWARATSNPATAAITVVGGVTPGYYNTALTGTTGTDGRINFGADTSGVIYIENRVGFAIAMSFWIFV